MKLSVALLLLVCLGASWAAPVEDGSQAASCTDPVVLGAANEAMDRINKDRKEGYVFALTSVANAHTQAHGENSVLFYLTLNVQETNCSVLSRTHFKRCEVRDLAMTPVYGQCKAAVFISRVNRVVRLYKYNCVVRPVPSAKVSFICPDCPTHIPKDNAEIQKTVSKAVEKFNKESGLTKYFRLLQVTRATTSYGMGMMYFAEFSIQETTCANPPQDPDQCPLMDCEFAHKGFCKGSHHHGPAGEVYDVNCEIYEPEAAEKEKKLHLLGGETDHSHDQTQDQTQDHTHDHTHAHAGHSHSHPHTHTHGHTHGHHDAAHDHSHDFPNQHHQYQHAPGTTTHQHDHELALDHAHKHAHLHEHEHHHHHHHAHPEAQPHQPEGVWRQTSPLGGPVTLPSFPDVPAGPEAGVTLPAKEDPQIPGQMEPTVGAFPTKLSPECPLPTVDEDSDDVVTKLLLEDPEFKLSA